MDSKDFVERYCKITSIIEVAYWLQSFEMSWMTCVTMPNGGFKKFLKKKLQAVLSNSISLTRFGTKNLKISEYMVFDNELYVENPNKIIFFA